MRLPKRGQRGFTLIELLIVVAILGVLAAVVIPNVSRFIGAGGEEAIDTEFANIQAAVSAMMVDNEIAVLDPPVADTTATNDMAAFPNVTATLVDKGATEAFVNASGVTEVEGYLLYGNQIVIDHNGDGVFDSGSAGPPVVLADEIRTVNYVAQPTTAYFYTVDSSGTVTQWDDTLMTNQLNP